MPLLPRLFPIRHAVCASASLLFVAERAKGDTLSTRLSTDPPPAATVADVHDDLKARITQFQDEWRKLWEKARTTMDGHQQEEQLDPNDPKNPRLRRNIALQCYIATPLIINSLLPMRPVVTNPDRGAICPMWFPPGGNEPSNEAESLDLSLRLSDRRRAYMLRDRLIGAIEAAHAKHPTDDWIAGQRVRFVYDQGSAPQTVAAARACRGTAGWCAMLLGLAHTQGEDLIEAESAFRQGEALGATMLDSVP